jgi:hypothetical protein
MAPLGGRTPMETAFMFDGIYSASYGQGFFTGELQAGQVNRSQTSFFFEDLFSAKFLHVTFHSGSYRTAA